eukprot:TRINITY_DN25268_c0_g1_i2.p1 TRINITY_DN25268_c0_g1~~TRINITY_DN25268_c0_g1_i2.p1  ORF type:complete len:813 (+),score=173.15 TRINITY_DN25268_c0_g1_i2:60-2441(+)
MASASSPLRKSWARKARRSCGSLVVICCLAFSFLWLLQLQAAFCQQAWHHGRRSTRPQVGRGRVARQIATAGEQYAAISSATSEQQYEEVLARADPNSPANVVFEKEKLWPFIWSRPFGVLEKLVSNFIIVAGIVWVWQTSESKPKQTDDEGFNPMSMRRSGPETPKGKALRDGLANMGVFFVKIGQTLAQRPDIVGDEVAEELKGMQEKNQPFSNEAALQIIAEDLRHSGPLAPGVVPNGNTDSGPTLFAEMTSSFVASASLGQVYKARLHDGREVAVKVQRPGVREAIGLDWAVAVLATDFYRWFKQSFNDFALIVDVVARGIRMELDYHNEATNAGEFAERHQFLPFVSAPAWVPEFTGPKGSARVLCLEWYPGRAPSELSRRERRELVQMAVESCIVQLLITGFVHADPHEGNLRMGEDGRIVFLDFGLMDRVEFDVMESFAAGIQHVINKDWLPLAKEMQNVRFTSTPTMKNTNFGISRFPQYEECSVEEFAEELGKCMLAEDRGLSRFGALATALKKLSNKYLMLTPPYVALLCRTFITLEGLLGDDPLQDDFNIYTAALPFAVLRAVSPRTPRARQALLEALFEQQGDGNQTRLVPRWGTLLALLGEQNEENTLDSDEVVLEDEAEVGGTAGVTLRLLRTTEGAALRRLLYEVDAFDVLRQLLVSPKARPLRRRLGKVLAQYWAKNRDKAHFEKKHWGPRAQASGKGWGPFDERNPFTLPKRALSRSKKAWRCVLKRQLKRMVWPPWRLPWRLTVDLAQVAIGFLALATRARGLSKKMKLHIVDRT